jgi:site-specific recombinase XerD
MEIREYLSYVKDKYHLSLATVERYKVALQSFYHWLLDEGFIQSNLMSKVKIVKPDKKLIGSLSTEQMCKLLDNFNGKSIEDYRNRAIVMLLLDTGLRCSEVANLRLGDIDIKRGIIKVMGKGRRERLARIGLKTQKALWHYLLRRGDNGSNDYLWLNQRHEKLTRYGIEEMLHKQGQKLGFRVYPHLLRHSFAINFLRNGANAFEVQYALGHSSLEMTRRYCSSLNWDDVYRKHQKASPVDNLK